MSVLSIGAHDVSEEQRALRDKLSSKESHIAAQQAQLMRQANEMEELRITLNDALHRLQYETNRALQLEATVAQNEEDLRNEKINVQNIKATLTAVQATIKQKETDIRELESTLQSVAHTSNQHNDRTHTLVREKGMLESRVRELELELQRQMPPPITPRAPVLNNRRRSSSLSSFKVTNLEQEVEEFRRTLAQKQEVLNNTTQKTSQLQEQLIKCENERLAITKRHERELQSLRDQLEEKSEELRSYQQYAGDPSREEELLRRIDEDEAKIAALEMLVGGAGDAKRLKEKLRLLEMKTQDDGQKLGEFESREARLLQGQEEVVTELQQVQEQLSVKTRLLRDKEQQLESVMNARSTFSGTSSDNLLVTINRLRAERDDLQRNLQFLQAESNFAIQSLEAKVATLSSARAQTPTPIHTGLDDEFIRRLGLMCSALSVIFAREHSLNISNETLLEDLRRQYSAMHSQLESKIQAAQESSVTNHELQLQLDEIKQRLEEASMRYEEVVVQSRAQDNHWSQEVATLRVSHQEYNSNIEHLELQKENLTRHLQNMESERDSFRLQVTNLTAELKQLQQQLADAESRYSQLQAHQLQSMSTSDATRALQRQVQELEARVMRRTEQVGIHQHDVKRLETNLRLQEERLTELTAELETISGQRDTMVEDCADAREARDMAVQQLEHLEVEMEAAESKLCSQAETITTLVEVIFKAMQKAADAGSLTRPAWAGARQYQSQFINAHEQLSHQALVLSDLSRKDDIAQDDIRQLALALAVHHRSLNATTQHLNTISDNHDALSAQVSVVQESLMVEQNRAAMLSDELNLARDKATDSTATSEARISTMDGQLQQLRDALAEKEEEHATTLERIAELEAKVQDLVRQQEEVMQTREQDQEVEELLKRIEEQSEQLEEAESRYAALQELHERSTEELAQSSKDLSEQVESLQAREAELQELKDAMAEMEEAQQSERARLQEDLDRALGEVSQSQKAAEEAQRLSQELEDEVVQLKTGVDAAHQSLHATKAQHEEESEQSQSALKEQEAKYAQISADKENLAQRLDMEIEGRVEDNRMHAQELQQANEQRMEIEQSMQTLQQKITELTEELAQSRSQVGDVQYSWDEKITALREENEHLTSLQSYLESQVQESQQTLLSVREELDKAREALAVNKNNAQAMENELTLQLTQFKRETAELREEVVALRARPKLDAIIAELEERNTEMEETLRSKCKEIEENDDRALEMLKANKKLNSKVETLTRKVQNLQTKLAAAKAAIPAAKGSAPPPSSPAEAPVPPPVPQDRRPPTSNQVQSPVGIASATSRSSDQPMPKSQPLPVPPPSKASEPPTWQTSEPEQMIGKKRPAPDDFDACESVPAQAFTADSVPGGPLPERKTPRLRRALSNPHASFTPVRSRRPATTAVSPQRGVAERPAAPHLITDVTNSPRQSNQSTRPSKRSWLGKIRGATTQLGERNILPTQQKSVE